jgi:hypothetical protein
MNALRKARSGSNFTPPPEAFDYDAEVTKEAVRTVQDRADKVRGNEELEVVEGYVNQRN